MPRFSPCPDSHHAPILANASLTLPCRKRANQVDGILETRGCSQRQMACRGSSTSVNAGPFAEPPRARPLGAAALPRALNHLDGGGDVLTRRVRDCSPGRSPSGDQSSAPAHPRPSGRGQQKRIHRRAGISGRPQRRREAHSRVPSWGPVLSSPYAAAAG
jgi:hypothetical protein